MHFYFILLALLGLFLQGCTSNIEVSPRDMEISLGKIEGFKPYETTIKSTNIKGDLISAICYKEIFFVKDKNNTDLTLENLLKSASDKLDKSDFQNVSVWMQRIDLGHAYKKICLELRKIND